MLPEIKKFYKLNESELFIAFTIMLVALLSFGLGRLSKIREGRVPVYIEGVSASAFDSLGSRASKSESKSEGLLVASKNGTKYHYPWCSGGKRIKEVNKVWFSSEEEALVAGYTPASNCKGLPR